MPQALIIDAFTISFELIYLLISIVDDSD